MRFFAFCLSLILFFSTSQFVLAAASPSITQQQVNQLMDVTDPGEVEIGQSAIYPGSPFYFLKSILEKIELSLTGSVEAKAMRQVEFSNRKLREVKTLIARGRQSEIGPLLSSYSDYTSQSIVTAQGDDTVKSKISETLARHLIVLQTIYNQLGDEGAKASVRQALLDAETKSSRLMVSLSGPVQQDLIYKIAGREANGCMVLTREGTSSGIPASEKEAIQKEVQNCQQLVGGLLKNQLEQLQQQRLQNSSKP